MANRIHCFITEPNNKNVFTKKTLTLTYELAALTINKISYIKNAVLNEPTLINYLKAADETEFLLNLNERAQNWLKTNATKYYTNEGTGLDMVFAHINHRNIRSLLKGTLVALV